MAPADARRMRCPKTAAGLFRSGSNDSLRSLRSMFISEGSVGRGRRGLCPVLMPCVDLVFRLKPISEVVPVFMAPVEPQFVGSLGDLSFQTGVRVRVKKRDGGFADRLLFHEMNSRQNAKQSHPEP